jgi:branched-chain amino acid transport system substrate-binding protein
MNMAGTRKRLGSAIVAAAAAIALTGLVALPSSGAATTYPAVDQPGVSAKEIKVGGVATASNDPTGGSLDSAFDGVKAYFASVNAKGGIYGRKLVLSAKRDDGLANNRNEVQGLLTDDDVFAVLPVAVQLYTGASLLADAKVPTYGWFINAEWGSEHSKPGPANFFTQIGDYHCFTCGLPSPQTWLPKQLKKHRIGTVAFNVTQSSDCATGIENSFKKYPTAKVVFVDKSLTFGSPDYSAQVAQMKDKNVDMVITCVDGNGTASLAREMKKQGLDATLLMPNSYNADLVKKNAQVLNGAYTFTTYAPFEAKPQSTGMKSYMKWIKKTGGKKNENSLVGWINADEFVTGLKAAGPNFTRQKVVDATNAITSYTAGGIVAPIDWTKAHDTDIECYAFEKVVNGKFVPMFGKKGKPFVCFPSTLTTIPKNPKVSS